MAGFEQNQQMRSVLQQSVVLSATQQLGLELLNLPLLKLEEALQAELLSNPALEELPAETPQISDETGDAPRGSVDDDDYESGFEVELAHQEEWNNELPLPPDEAENARDRKAELMSNSPAPAPTLRDLMMVEAETTDIPPQLRELVFEIISSLDPDGFLTLSPADLLMNCAGFQDGGELDEADMADALEIVRKLAPPGVWIGQRSEFFKIQLKNAGKLDDTMSALCDELESLPEYFTGKNPDQQALELLSRRMQLPESKIKDMLAVLNGLNLPLFSCSGESGETEFIQPDLEFNLLPDGRLQVVQLRGMRRSFGVSPVYEEMLEKRTLSGDDRKYLKEKVSRAQNFIKALAMRDSTLLRLGELIASRQRGFFTAGISELKSFTMSEAAEMLGYDASTITRAVQNKYARTPQGILPLRFFFPGGGHGSEKDRSQPAIMEDIRRIIDNENPAYPFSDEQISRQLNQAGVKIERRTVAKYRTIMNIPAASKRKG